MSVNLLDSADIALHIFSSSR